MNEQSADKRRRVIVMGAAGRDFHNFNMALRGDLTREVVAFTAAQIPGIADRRYPPSLAGPHYPNGIPILPEEDLARLIRKHRIDDVIFAYSDVEHALVMHKASIALSAGADFTLLGPKSTMVNSRLPVIAVCAVRTGVGKSQTTRWLAHLIKTRGLKTAVIRHPMPYGNLAMQAVQRFATMADLDAAHCTIEEREEYEPHIAAGSIVFAGIDYAAIVARAEREADLILWDGGNNDFAFVRPDLHIVMVDPLRPGHETSYHPGEAVLRMADIVIVAKTNAASATAVETVIGNARAIAPGATIVRAASVVRLDEPDRVRGKRVLVVDDGPTITHGGMPYGAGFIAATEAGASEIVDPRASAHGDIVDVFANYGHIGRVLPAMGYSDDQLGDLAATINGSNADVVVSGTPSDLGHLMALDKPVVRARYDFQQVGEPRLSDLVNRFLDSRGFPPNGRHRNIPT
jgi:predicted GTPase